MAEFNLGTLYQKLTLDIKDFVQGIARAIAEADKLKSHLSDMGTKTVEAFDPSTVETAIRKGVTDPVEKGAKKSKDTMEAMWEANIRSADKAAAELETITARRVNKELKDEDKKAAERSKLLERYGRSTREDSEKLAQYLAENERYVALESSRARAEMAGGWREFFFNTKEGFREFFAEATRNFSGIQDTATASFSQIAAGVVKMSLGFAIAMAATSLLSRVIEGLSAVIGSAIRSFGEFEAQAIQTARSLTLSGQRLPEDFARTTKEVQRAIPALREMASEIGVNANEFILFNNRLQEMGFGWEESAKFARDAALIFKTAYGESSQFWVAQQELLDLVYGKIEDSKTIIRLLGATAAEEIRNVANMEGIGAASDKLRQALGITNEQLEIQKASLQSVVALLGDAWEQATGGGFAAEQLAKAWGSLLKSIIADLKNQGVLWATINGLINAAAVLVRSLYSGFVLVAAPVSEMLGDVGRVAAILGTMVGSIEEVASRWRELGNAPITQKFSAVYDIVRGISREMNQVVASEREISTILDNQARARTSLRSVMQQMKIEADNFEKTSRATLEMDKSKLELDKARASFGADSITRAKTEMSIGSQSAEIEKQQLINMNRRIESQMAVAEAAKELTHQSRIEFENLIKQNQQKIQTIDNQKEINDLQQRENILSGQLEAIKTKESNTREKIAAQQAETEARLQQQQSSLVEQEKARTNARLADIANQRQANAEQLNIIRQTVGEEKFSQRLDVQALEAKQKALAVQEQALSTATEIKLRQIETNKLIDDQNTKYQMQAETLKNELAQTQLDLQAETIRASMDISISADELLKKKSLQLRTQEEILRAEKESISLSAQKAILDLQAAKSLATSSEEIAKAENAMQRQLQALQGQAVLNQKNLELLDLQHQRMIMMLELSQQRMNAELGLIQAQGEVNKINVAAQIQQLRLQSQILAPIDQQLLGGKIQLEQKQKLLETEREIIGMQAQKEVLAYREARARTTEADQIKRLEQNLTINLAKLQEQADLNELNVGLLAAQADQLERMEKVELGKKLAGEIKGALDGFFDGLHEGSLEFQELFQDLSKAFFERFKENTLDRMVNAFVSKMESALDGLFGMGGSFWMGLIGAGFFALSTLFNKQKAEVEALGDQAKSNIEEIERTRGLIAGETNIAIQQVNQSLKEALRETNTILYEIRDNTARSASSSSQPKSSTQAPYGDMFGGELIGAQRI